jgi:hypothetical protein
MRSHERLSLSVVPIHMFSIMPCLETVTLVVRKRSHRSRELRGTEGSDQGDRPR